MAMAMAAAAAASPSCSSPPWPASSSTRTRSTSSSCSLLYTATTTRPAASPSGRRLGRPRALPETALVAAGVAAAGVAAAVLLRGDRKTEQPAPGEQGEKQEASEECSACGGSGLCPRCKGEGFVFKEVGEEAAGRARRAAKNMATRYTAGLPTKWTYCNRCSSTRSCTACDGSGAVPVRAKTTTTN